MNEARRVVGLDIDGVVLDYFEGIIEWAAGRGVRIGCRADEVDEYSMVRAFPDMDEDSILDMVREFNEQEAFGRLEPYEGALDVIAGLVEDYDVDLVAITSAGAKEITRLLRVGNLEGLGFGEIHVIGIKESKRDRLALLPPGSIYVDDLMHHLAVADDVGLTTILYRQPYNAIHEHDRVAEGWADLDRQIRSILDASPAVRFG